MHFRWFRGKNPAIFPSDQKWARFWSLAGWCGWQKTLRAKLENGKNRECRKCMEEVFNHLCNCVKMRDLACEKFGRKCCKKFEIMFVIQKFLLPLQPIN